MLSLVIKDVVLIQTIIHVKHEYNLNSNIMTNCEYIKIYYENYKMRSNNIMI